MKAFVLFIGCLLLFTSCEKKNHIVFVEKSLDEFEVINLQSYFEVYLTQGNENKITIEGSEKICSKLSISVSNERLTVKNDYKGGWLSPKKNNIKLHITFKKLSLIQADETCKIWSTGQLSGEELGIVFASKLNEADLDLNYTTVYYWNNFPCGGKLNLKGTCNDLKIWNYALMSVDARNLVTQNVFIENSSKGDCHVQAQQNMEYSIFGEGNIYLYGNPLLIKEDKITSEGKLIKL